MYLSTYDVGCLSKQVKIMNYLTIQHLQIQPLGLNFTKHRAWRIRLHAIRFSFSLPLSGHAARVRHEVT